MSYNNREILLTVNLEKGSDLRDTFIKTVKGKKITVANKFKSNCTSVTTLSERFIEFVTSQDAKPKPYQDNKAYKAWRNWSNIEKIRYYIKTIVSDQLGINQDELKGMVHYKFEFIK